MRLLILGGTRFLGRHLVEAALRRGDQVTLFNRGQTHPDLFPQVERIRGDRDGDLGRLAGRRWDAVVDTCGFVPRAVRASAEFLRDKVEHYTFISSASVYADFATRGMDESAPVGKLEDAAVEEITAETYGPLKTLCERALEEAIPGRALSVRAGLIVGPHDYTDRFSYWPRRIAQGGEVLAPGRSGAPVQFIDARDLAEWVLAMGQARCGGVFNATGPIQPLTLGELFETCRRITGSDARFTWVSETFLKERRVEPFSELPLWVPEDESPGFNTLDCRRAIQAGLRTRLLEETVGETLAWDSGQAPEKRGAGERIDHPRPISREREVELLAAWRAG